MLNICNIVLVGRFKGVNFDEAKKLWSGKRNFNGVVLRLPSYTVLLFPNGSTTVVGVKSMSLITGITPSLLTKLPGVNVAISKPLRICNIVASMSVGKPINLPNFYDWLKPRVFLTYTPETFPGMKVTLRGNMVAIVFHTGKINITGARTLDDLAYGEKTILDMLNKCKIR
jgi:TATA-box binding protein (TBP) (component of TFIID and TFIIIB)